LSDPQKKTIFDRYGEEGLKAGGGGGGGTGFSRSSSQGGFEGFPEGFSGFTAQDPFKIFEQFSRQRGGGGGGRGFQSQSSFAGDDFGDAFSGIFLIS
jgi:DnaJ family protein B protein 4